MIKILVIFTLCLFFFTTFTTNANNKQRQSLVYNHAGLKDSNLKSVESVGMASYSKRTNDKNRNLNLKSDESFVLKGYGYDENGNKQPLNRTVKELLQAMNEMSVEMKPELKLVEFFNSEEYFEDYDALLVRKRITLYVTSFVWLFKDLHNIVFKYPNDENLNIYRELINEHCDEDGTHWKMFIYDWEQ
jgi:hypothetical protein